MTLEEMKRLAAAATPGPWNQGKHARSVWKGHCDFAPIVAELTRTDADAAFIAAFNPETAIRLVEAVELAVKALRIASRAHAETKDYWSIGHSADFEKAVTDFAMAVKPMWPTPGEPKGGEP